MTVENGGISLHDYVAIANTWNRGLYLPAEFTPQMRFARATEELDELRAEVFTPDPKPERIVAEAADCFLGFLTIACTVAPPYHVANITFDTLVRAMRKYPPYEVQRLRHEGLTTSAAMAALKARHNGK